jgi:hypothetical protein
MDSNKDVLLYMRGRPQHCCTQVASTHQQHIPITSQITPYATAADMLLTVWKECGSLVCAAQLHQTPSKRKHPAYVCVSKATVQLAVSNTVYCCVAWSYLTWQIKQHQPNSIWVQLLHLPSEQKAATSQGAHQRVQEVEHLLCCPAILWHTQLNTDQLHLHVCFIGVSLVLVRQHSRIDSRETTRSQLTRATKAIRP